MTLPACLNKDTWLGEILGLNAYHLDAHSFTALQTKLTEFALQRPYFIDTKVSCDDVIALTALQKHGFNVIDTNVTYELNFTQCNRHQNSTYHFRYAEPQDAREVTNCAANSFVYTRYHLDPQISTEKAHLIKALWAGNYFKGSRGQKMTLATHSDQQVVGFCQILEPDSQTRIIDLIAVDSNHRRQGLAQSMITFGLESETKIVVGTQVSNIPSIRCYESMGFKQFKSQYVLHYHSN